MRTLKALLIFIGILVLTTWITNTYIKLKAEPNIFTNPQDVPFVEAVLVPGASVYRSGELSPILKFRVETAINFASKKDSLPLFLSGHSIKGGYNEPMAMKEYSIAKGVLAPHIIIDEQGTSTYTSLVNFKKQTKFKSLLIVSQKFHLPRALLIARNLGFDAYGLVAQGSKNSSPSEIHLREVFSRIKDLFLIKFFKLFTP